MTPPPKHSKSEPERVLVVVPGPLGHQRSALRCGVHRSGYLRCDGGGASYGCRGGRLPPRAPCFAGRPSRHAPGRLAQTLYVLVRPQALGFVRPPSSPWKITHVAARASDRSVTRAARGCSRQRAPRPPARRRRLQAPTDPRAAIRTGTIRRSVTRTTRSAPR